MSVLSFITKYILDVVLDGCVIYRLLLVLTQRDILYQNYHRTVNIRKQGIKLQL
jgi:hypothetical protein